MSRAYSRRSRGRAAYRLTGMSTVGCLTAALISTVPSVDAATRPAPQVALSDRSSAPGYPDAVTAWNAYAGEAAVAACIAPVGNPLTESRMYAMTQIAVSDALNTIRPRYQRYALHMRLHPHASAKAAVASAAAHVLKPLLRQIPAPFPPSCGAAGAAVIEGHYAAALAALPNSRATARGLAVGRAAATAILQRRAHDGSDTPLVVADFPQGTAPGEWRFTPGTPFAFAPGWGGVTPFVLRSSHQFDPGRPYSVTSDGYTRDFNEIKALGGDDVTTPSARTADQTEVALFWVESSPLRWNRIARTAATGRRLSLWQKARLFGLLDVALADGYISSFRTKYHYLFWRPVTAIQAANTDGNPATSADPTWTPLITTPPIPEWESAHAVEGGAGARVLARFFGRDTVGFAACSLTLPAGSTCTDPSPVLRRYASFDQAAHENAVSRVYVGIHFRTSALTGNRRGHRVGDRAVNVSFRPV